MKKFSVRMTSVSLAIASLAVLPLPANAADAQKLLVLGDSISAGYAVEGGQYGYYDYLTQCMGYEMTNLAVSGYETTDLMAQMADEEVQAAIQAADVISISIGANDMLTPFMKYINSIMEEGESYQELFTRLDTEGSLVSHVSKLSGYVRPNIEEAKTNLVQIETDLLALNPDVTIVMQTIYNPVEYDEAAIEASGYGSSYKLLHNYVRNSTNMINEAILALEHSRVADVSAAFEGTGWIYIRVQEQDVHPTQLGHALIGATVLNAMGITEGEIPAMAITFDRLTTDDAAVLPDNDRAVMEPFIMALYDRGDANNDGNVDSIDAVLALRQYNSAVIMNAGDILEPLGKYAVDTDQNGALEPTDAIGILRYYALFLGNPDITWEDVFS